MKKWLRLSCADFTETTDELRNPFRGWYQIYTFCAEREPDFDELIWCLRAEESCALILLDIGAYKNSDLDERSLSNIQNILSFFDGHKKDIILRVVYDREGKGAEHEPTLLGRVIAHIRQLEPIIQKFRDRIVFFEGMFVGNWGEMHGSRFLSKEHMLLLNAELERSTAGIIRAVRQPAQWRMLHNELPTEGTVVALYNDAVFGTDTDMGTFAPNGEGSEEWEAPWAKERELEFEERLGEFVPQCGEAVCGDDYRNQTLETTVERLRKMHLTCLNGVYDEKILGIWKEWTWNASDAWRGINGYDYIGRHLGYRFCLRSAEAKSYGSFCEISLTVENIGFSGFYQEAEALLVLTGKSGEIKEYLTDWDIRDLKSGQRKTLTWRIQPCEGKVYLYVRRKWDRETVRFANTSTPEGLVFIGELKM